MYKSGYTVLLLTIIVSAVGTALAIGALSVSTQVGKTNIDVTDAEIALSQARSCTEKVLARLRMYTFYAGDETLSPENCRVLGITGTGNGTRIIQVKKDNRILETKISQILPNTIIDYQKPIDYTLNNGDSTARTWNVNNPYLIAPTNITLWLKADLAQRNPGSTVLTLNDASNTNTPFTQSTESLAPRLALYSFSNTTPARPVLRFDGINDFLSGTTTSLHNNTNGLSVFAVTKTTNTNPSQSIIAKFDTAQNQREWRLQNTQFQVAENGAINNDTNERATITASTNVQLLQGIWTPNNPVRSFINNGAANLGLVSINNITVVNGANPLEPIVIGAQQSPTPNAFLNGDIAEIIVLNTAATTDQRNAILTYLNTKYTIY